MKTILVGAVAYDPRVVTIWDIIKEFFITEGCPCDYVLYSNYELMQEALVRGDIDIAWNSPLAWLDACRKTDGACRAIAMRDTDRDRVSHILVRKDSGIKSLSDLEGKTVALGASDSPQAKLIPLNLIHNAGVTVNAVLHNILVGKHGDHIGGELEALKDLSEGRANACAVLDLNWQAWSTNGTADPAKLEILATTPPFDHCVFTIKSDFDPALEKHWLEVLFRMDYANPDHKEMMDLEGLKQWEPGRTSGFAQLTEATERQGFWV